MIQYIVVVKDTALGAYLTPFFSPGLGVAVRQFGDEVANPESPLNKHPEDYILFECGSFDTDTGQFTCYEPRQIARAQDYRAH